MTGGRVLVDLAVMIADGGEAICDIDVLRHQGEVFGPVASDTTAWRALDEIGATPLRRITVARAKVRARLWQLFGGPPQARAAGRGIGERVVVLDVDSTIVIAHSDKERAAATYKHTYGFQPILVTCDNTNELLAVRLRPGNAGANTAADHLSVLGDAIAQIPAQHRRHLLPSAGCLIGVLMPWPVLSARAGRSRRQADDLHDHDQGNGREGRVGRPAICVVDLEREARSRKMR